MQNPAMELFQQGFSASPRVLHLLPGNFDSTEERMERGVTQNVLNCSDICILVRRMYPDLSLLM